ncbi:preprotein translocase subunit SecE [Sphingomonas zeicaulis]|uniref:preprotein translocase subunit SecE n=1 Tax=Sphingomonas zeicaulis TaxID=1632740 RepID=UPI003D2145EE
MAKFNPGQFVNQVKAETAKVVWPTGRETALTAVMVVIMTTLLGVFFFGVDRLFGFVMKALVDLVAG